MPKLLIYTKLLLIALIANTGLLEAAAYQNYACQDNCNTLWLVNLRRYESCLESCPQLNQNR